MIVTHSMRPKPVSPEFPMASTIRQISLAGVAMMDLGDIQERKFVIVRRETMEYNEAASFWGPFPKRLAVPLSALLSNGRSSGKSSLQTNGRC